VTRDERERRAQQRIESQVANRYEKRLRRELVNGIREAADQWEAGRSLESALASHNEKIESAMRAMWTDAFERIGERVERQLNESAKGWFPGERKELGTATMRALEGFIARWGSLKLRAINQTTMRWIQRQITAGIEEGFSTIDIAGLITQQAPSISAWRAVVIASTETHTAGNFGNITVARESGRDLMKRWVHVNDDRVREGDNSDFDHTSVEPVLLNESFDVSGELLDYPGDPNGSAGNIILCRCAVTYRRRQ
jgi:hypothetical protein